MLTTPNTKINAKYARLTWPSIIDYWNKAYQEMNKEPKVYIIKRHNKRFNNKTFNSYEEARKYVRRTVTKLVGGYVDSFSPLGFSIEAR